MLIIANVLGVALIGATLVTRYVAPYCTDDPQPSLVPGVDVHRWHPEPDPSPSFEVGDVSHFHPGVWAQSGLALLDDGRHADARRLADELWAQGEEGWFAYGFDWPATGQEAPWYSAMDQGQALGLFSQLGMLEHAAAVYATLQPGSRVIGADDWPLEYPGFPPVLNGAIFAIFGMYEYWEATGDPTVKARTEELVSVIARDIHRFRTPGGISTYERDGSRRYAHYHAIHVEQLRALAEATSMPCLSQAADDFDRDA